MASFEILSFGRIVWSLQDSEGVIYSQPRQTPGVVPLLFEVSLKAECVNPPPTCLLMACINDI